MHIGEGVGAFNIAYDMRYDCDRDFVFTTKDILICISIIWVLIFTVIIVKRILTLFLVCWMPLFNVCKGNQQE